MQVDRALLGRTSRRCAAPNCNRRSSFNYINAASGLFCGQHKLEGMINVRTKQLAAQFERVCLQLSVPNYVSS